MLVFKSFLSLRQWQPSEEEGKRKNELAREARENRARDYHFTPLLRPATRASLSRVISLAKTCKRRSVGSKYLICEFLI